MYNLRIRAKDLGRPSLEATKTYTIRITDMNDNNPVFNPSSYTKEVPENTPINTEVLKVHPHFIFVFFLCSISKRILYLSPVMFFMNINRSKIGLLETIVLSKGQVVENFGQ